MFVGKNIVYLDLQKTGSTQITKVLKSISSEEGQKFRKHITFHQLPAKSKIAWDEKVKLGSIRDPWSWYVSLWAYGCGGKGALYNTNTQLNWKLLTKKKKFSGLLIPRKKWRSVYQDVHSKEQFKEWLSMILFPKSKHTFLEYNSSPVFQNAGLYTHRYLRLYLKDFIKLQNQMTSKESIIQLDSTYNLLNEIIRQENLKDELFQFLNQQHIEITDSIKALFKRRINSSYHLHYKDYYDEESINWIKEKEWFIIDKYAYQY